MKTGTVKFFDETKHFGFIIVDPAGQSPDVFVHETDLKNLKLQKDEKVSFDVETTPKGSKAINVTKIAVTA